MEKEILASLEIADHEVRLLVGQFYNGRLNILKVEQVPHQGVSAYSIVDESLVVEAISKAIENASRNLGIVIEKIILMVPGVQMKHQTKQMQIPITGKVSAMDIKRAYGEFLSSGSMDDYVLSNVIMSKYFINGSSTRKLPLNERCSHLTIEADCYYSKQNIIFPYVSAVEAAGLQIIDVVLDDIALAKEASLFEKSIDKPLIVYTLSLHRSKMTLYYKGKLVSNDFDSEGFQNFMDLLQINLGVPYDVVERLLYYNVDLMNDKHKEDPIFIWSRKGVSYTISSKDIADQVNEPIQNYLKELIHRSEPIFELGNPEILITGGASVVGGITDYVASISNARVEGYEAKTFGITNPRFSALVGAFYFYKDYQIFRNTSEFSAKQIEFKEHVLQYTDNEESESMTQKLKKAFFERT